MAFEYSAWYARHGEELNQSRRSRYSSDPEYRAQVLERNRQARLKQREERRQVKQTEHDASDVKSKAAAFKHVEIEIKQGGKKVKVVAFSIGTLAKAVGRSVKVLRLWEAKGVIPKTELRDEKGERLYVLDQVEQIRKIAEGRRRDALDAAKRRPEVPRYYKIRTQDGAEVVKPLFRIGALALVSERSVVTLIQLEQKGHLPTTPLRSPKKKGHRLYTHDQIEAVRSAFESRAWELRGPAAWRAFSDEIVARWEQLGLVGSKCRVIEPIKPAASASAESAAA